MYGTNCSASMKSITYFCLLSVFFSACTKVSNEDILITPEPIDSVASYKIIVTGTWAMPQQTVPANNHFTQFIGLIHSDACRIYQLGTLASKGVENVAEEGKPAVLNMELDNNIAAGKALSKFFISLPNITATDSATLNVTIKHSKISFESMIAPSPDWFVGIDSYNLIQNGKWVKDITIPAYGYDAGTEDGDVFGYANPATVPQQNISYMTPTNASIIANGNASIAPFASIRFVKL